MKVANKSGFKSFRIPPPVLLRELSSNPRRRPILHTGALAFRPQSHLLRSASPPFSDRTTNNNTIMTSCRVKQRATTAENKLDLLPRLSSFFPVSHSPILCTGDLRHPPPRRLLLPRGLHRRQQDYPVFRPSLSPVCCLPATCTCGSFLLVSFPSPFSLSFG